MRPIIVVDGTFFKGKILWHFVCYCMDKNNQIFPLAFRVGDSKNDALWTWFLTKLRGAIGEIDDLVPISDRHDSI